MAYLIKPKDMSEEAQSKLRQQAIEAGLKQRAKMTKRKVREFGGVPYELYGTARESAVADSVQLACQRGGAITRLTHRIFPREYFIWVKVG